MIYHFLPRIWHGEVIAEDRIASSHSFLNHRFPASDIPKPARDLYLKNQVRFIYDATAAVSPIYPQQNTKTGETIDLQDSRLRAVAPVHLEYLKNMQVTSSFSVAIIVDGELWGLIACHHFSPLKVSAQIRSACQILAQAFAARVGAEEKFVSSKQRLQFETDLREFILSVRNRRQPLTEFLKDHQKMRQLFSANGLALINKDSIELAGVTPPTAVIKQMIPMVDSEMNHDHKDYFATACLIRSNPAWDFFRAEASGLLAVRLSDLPESYLFVFRPEVIQTIDWGGDPRKILEKRNYQGSINPRASFESWRETIQGHSREWQDYEIDGIRYLRDLVFGTFALNEKLMQELSEKMGRTER
jgi:light-regulated signal transduction histidine kinase (bacteriophytochrome)